MDRRELLQLGAVSAAVAATMTKEVLAQGAAPAPAAPPSFKLSLDACSRNLQWLRTPQELAKGCTDLALQSVDLTVAAYPGHVDPAKVKTDLPAFVNGLKASGISVNAISTPIVDADSPYAEDILATAASLGIRYYGWGGFKYTDGPAYTAQLDALKPRVDKLVKLNQKYKIKALYQPVAGVTNVGSAFFDLLEVLRAFDPKFVGFRYDTAALLAPMRDVFVSHMRLGAPYIGAMALNDGEVSLDLPFYQYGPFDQGRNEDANAGPAGDNTGNDNGNPLAIGGGGWPLPYHFHPKRVGTGMIDLQLIGRTLKAINFDGPIETQLTTPLGGAETGADKISMPRQAVVGQIKRDRLTVEAGFFDAGWTVDIVRPAFMTPGAPAGGRGGRGGAAAPAGGGRGGAAGGGAAP